MRKWRTYLFVLLGAIRAGWLILGIALAMFLGLESAYGVIEAYAAGNARISPLHPYAQAAWFQEFTERGGSRGRWRFLLDPYRLYRMASLRSPPLNVDALGRRHTTSGVRDPATALRVFMLGGSAMWGFGARDSHTVPSLLSAELRMRGLDNVEILNLALLGYNTTQEATTLVVELANGNRPDAAIFLNGYNDMATAFRFGEPGRAFTVEVAQKQLDQANLSFWPDLLSLGRHSRIVRRLVPPSERHDIPGAEDLMVCGAVASYYRQIARMTAAMGREHGFEVFQFLQPLHHTTSKPLSAYERTLSIEPAFRACTEAIDRAMADRLGRNYFQAYRLFDTTAETVFVDRHSHITEKANGTLAAHMAEIVAPSLQARAKERDTARAAPNSLNSSGASRAPVPGARPR